MQENMGILKVKVKVQNTGHLVTQKKVTLLSQVGS
jgi:hypothetical protein